MGARHGHSALSRGVYRAPRRNWICGPRQAVANRRPSLVSGSRAALRDGWPGRPFVPRNGHPRRPGNFLPLPCHGSTSQNPHRSSNDAVVHHGMMAVQPEEIPSEQKNKTKLRSLLEALKKLLFFEERALRVQRGFSGLVELVSVAERINRYHLQQARLGQFGSPFWAPSGALLVLAGQ